MFSDEAWEAAAADLLKAEMVRRKVTAAALAAVMSAHGSPVSASGIRSKLSRGTFGAGFMLRALVALGCDAAEMGRLLAFTTAHLQRPAADEDDASRS